MTWVIRELDGKEHFYDDFRVFMQTVEYRMSKGHTIIISQYQRGNDLRYSLLDFIRSHGKPTYDEIVAYAGGKGYDEDEAKKGLENLKCMAEIYITRDDEGVFHYHSVD